MTKLEWLKDLSVNEVKSVHRYIAKSSDYPMTNHGRAYHGFIFTLQGTEIYHFSGKDIYATPNSVVYIPQGEKYTIDLIGEKSDVIVFDFFISQYPDASPFVTEFKSNTNMQIYFSESEKLWNGTKPECISECKSYFYKINSELIKKTTHYVNSKNYDKIAESISYLHAHYLDPDFKIKTLSDIAGMTPRYFEILFTKEFNMSAKEYVIFLKIKLAKEFLLSEKNSVSDVALKLGYSDVFHFSKIFKAKTGYSPSEFKRI